jgi:hypothetical protein
MIERSLNEETFHFKNEVEKPPQPNLSLTVPAVLPPHAPTVVGTTQAYGSSSNSGIMASCAQSSAAKSPQLPQTAK